MEGRGHFSQEEALGQSHARQQQQQQMVGPFVMPSPLHEPMTPMTRLMQQVYNLLYPYYISHCLFSFLSSKPPHRPHKHKPLPQINHRLIF